MKVRLHIRTYDSIPTDLAGEMRQWREFVRGDGCTVYLRDPDTRDEVSICMRDSADDYPTVIIEGPGRSKLLDRAIGRAMQALAEHSDNLMVDQRTIAEAGSSPNGGPDRPSVGDQLNR